MSLRDNLNVSGKTMKSPKLFLFQKVRKGIFLKLMFNIQKNFMNFTISLPFLPERKKLKKVEKFVANLHGKNEYVIHIRSYKQALNH